MTTIFNTRYQYGLVSITLHWIAFVLIVGLIASGKYSDSLPPEEKIGLLIGTHKQVGVVLLVLMLFRFFWKIFNTTVESFSESVILHTVAILTHLSMYIVVVLQVATGVFMSQLSDRAVTVFGQQLPTFLSAKKGEGLLGSLEEYSFFPQVSTEAAKFFREWHEIFAHLFIALIVLHIIGLLFHRFILSDETASRMSPSYKPHV